MNKQVFIRTEHLDDHSCSDHPGKTRIPREVFQLRDLKAIGIYSYLLTYPKGEIFTPGRIAEGSRDGVDSVKTGLEALFKIGWIEQANLPKNFGWVYILKALETLTPTYKIGKAEDPWQRYVEWSLASPVPLEVVRFIPASDRGKLETSLHRKYEAKRLSFNGRRGEWFALSPEEVEEIKAMEATL